MKWYVMVIERLEYVLKWRNDWNNKRIEVFM